MRKAGKKQRDIKFCSKKNGKVMTVHTMQELAYAKQLEDDDTVISYEYGASFDPGKLSLVKTVDIRGAYLEEEWQSDYILTFKDGARGIRELETEKNLEKLPVIEKLELSRRYWGICGIYDWKIVIGGAACS